MFFANSRIELFFRNIPPPLSLKKESYSYEDAKSSVDVLAKSGVWLLAIQCWHVRLS